MRLILLLCCILASIFVYSNAFVQPTSFRTGVKDTSFTNTNFQQPLISSSTSTYISTLHTSSLLKLSPWDKDEDDNVNVQELEVDAFTLTCVGFGLIAFNFLVLGNMGDMGVGGVIARIMNTFG